MCKTYVTDRAWTEINLSALRHNANMLKSLLPARNTLMAVVKADGYGHGAVAVAQALAHDGMREFAVATVDEGITLRENGIPGEILILGCTPPERVDALQEFMLTPTVADHIHAAALAKQVCGRLKVHLKIDTGMHRLGEDFHHLKEITQIFSIEQLHVTGLYTHLCVSDSQLAADREFTQAQLNHFFSLVRTLRTKGIDPGRIHVQGSYGILNYPDIPCDLARAGIALYGVYSTDDPVRACHDLRAVLSLRARVVHVLDLACGETAGYGCMHTAQKNERLAVLSIGYADGIPRGLSCGKGAVLIHGHRVPIAGRICMDQTLVNITGLPQVALGDTATLIGADGAERIRAEEVATASDTITNELLSRLGSRLGRLILS